MKVPYRWLQDYVQIDTDIQTLSDALVMTGNAVEGITPPRSDISNVVAGRILKLEKHPDADKLQICQLDVGGAVGAGILNVIRDMGLKEPYVGQCELQTGEIGDDLTYYFATSEQVPSSVGVGVLMDKGNTVRQAGGFIIQLMPFTSDEVIDRLEAKLSEVKSVTTMLDGGMTPEQILEELLGEFGLEINDTLPTQYHCNCSRERIEKALISIGKKDLQEMINDGEPIEVGCQFCDKKYQVTVDELKGLLARSSR